MFAHRRLLRPLQAFLVLQGPCRALGQPLESLEGRQANDPPHHRVHSDCVYGLDTGSSQTAIAGGEMNGSHELTIRKYFGNGLLAEELDTSNVTSSDRD